MQAEGGMEDGGGAIIQDVINLGGSVPRPIVQEQLS